MRGTPLANLILILAGVGLLAIGLYFDEAHVLRLARFPALQYNDWVRADLATLRGVAVLTATLLIVSQAVLLAAPRVVARWCDRIETFMRAAAQSRLFTPLALATVVLTHAVLQLGLYLIGYRVFAADDFTRSLSAAYWSHYQKFTLGAEGWRGLGLSGSGWLPFPDYLFGAALRFHEDLFITPKIVNLVISGILVIAVYFLGRELFGRAVGLLTASLFAFQPWHVWLGVSGMTSDLPSVVLVVLFGAFLYRWLRSDEPRWLLGAAAFLGVANGFRFENWFFSLVLSLLILFMTVLRWRRGEASGRWVLLGACALAIVNAFPLIWMTASYFVLGDWLPMVHVVAHFSTLALAGPSTANRPLFNIPVFALGTSPFEIVLSLLGVAWCFYSAAERRGLGLYSAVPALTFLLFSVVFKWQLPGYASSARYFLPYIALVLPFAAFLLVRLFMAPSPWRAHALIACSLVLVAIAALDIGRAVNYPNMFPNDAIYAGWTIRSLQATGMVPADGKILIERADDWGELGVVVLANGPERFVAINDVANRPPAALADGACQAGFETDACKTAFLREGFRLVVLSTPSRVASFRQAFNARVWNIGRYHVFDMQSMP